MRIIFMGSPDFAVPSLEALHREHEIAAVLTQPDRPAGRGREPSASAVKQRAIELGLDVLQPASLKDETVLQTLTGVGADLIVVAAYGKILPEAVLNLPARGAINVHASLLPRWRGAAPIQAAILAGDTETGVTIMQMEAGLDTGPVLSQQAVTIRATETGGELAARLADLGADLLKDTLPGYLQGSVVPEPQDERRATYAPMIRKSDGRLNFNQPASYLVRQVRAYEPWPTSYFFWKDTRIVVRSAYTLEPTRLMPGQTGIVDALPAIGCAEGALVLDVLQPAGKRAMRGDEFLNGARHFPGSQLELQAQE